ncbi:hypothetical protein FE634_19095 [Nocardioides dongxiaopingii]|nr:hypothetical protein [Nocardioides sp. S-1144]QCW51984.2 hypothetical protein FE634_19095 [Nocardioides sp. S-1144]
MAGAHVRGDRLDDLLGALAPRVLGPQLVAALGPPADRDLVEVVLTLVAAPHALLLERGREGAGVQRHVAAGVVDQGQHEGHRGVGVGDPGGEVGQRAPGRLRLVDPGADHRLVAHAGVGGDHEPGGRGGQVGGLEQRARDDVDHPGAGTGLGEPVAHGTDPEGVLVLTVLAVVADVDEGRGERPVDLEDGGEG